MARALLAALAFLLAACGRAPEARAPFLESRTPPGLAGRFYPPEGWAWGLVRTGDFPAQRYGVGSPPVVPRAEILIVPGYGESAETWFETANDLIARGATVWILDRAGQGGSERFAAPRDVVHAPSFAPDAAAIRAVRDVVIRGRPERPFLILASADGAVAAMRALETGLAADGLILSAPRLAPPAPAAPLQALALRVGLGHLPAPGRRRWTRNGPDGVALGLTHDRMRGGVTDAWRLANPDLRVSGPSLAWVAGYAAASRAAARDAPALRTPVLVLLPDGGQGPLQALCRRLPRCEGRTIAGARPALHLEQDSARKVWLEAVAGRVRSLSPLGPPPDFR